MGKHEKLLEKLCRRPPEAEFDDVERLLADLGFVPTNTTGSHFVFRHDDGRQITVPTVKGRKVKKPYIDRVLDPVEVEEEKANEPEEH